MAPSDTVFCTHCREHIPRSTMQDHRAAQKAGARAKRPRRTVDADSSSSDSEFEDSILERQSRPVRTLPRSATTRSARHASLSGPTRSSSSPSPPGDDMPPLADLSSDEDSDDEDGGPERAETRHEARKAAWNALLRNGPQQKPQARAHEGSSPEPANQRGGGGEDQEVPPTDESEEDSDVDSVEGEEDVSDSDPDDELDRQAWYELVEEIEQAGSNPDDLSPLTMAALRAFALKVTDHLTEKTFAKLPHAFPNDCHMSWKQTRSVAEKLSGFKPEKYDMCRDSCVLFVGPYAHLRNCPKPKCGKDRYDARGRPVKQFTYLPLIPRLKAFLANIDIAKKSQYRAKEHQHSAEKMTDVFDSTLYRNLRKRRVKINGKEKSFRYFSDDRDVAYGVSMDGMAPFKRRKNTCWPILVFDYNLPPEIRFLKDYVLCLGEVPGPKKPYYFDSFLYPFIQEALKLEIGIAAYDCLTDETFTLRGYLLYVFGDMPAMSMAMRMLGTNAIFPCRACHIRGIRVPGAKKSTTHYVPLDRTQHPAIPDNPDLVPKYDPLQLPKRTHDEFMAQAQYVHAAPYPAEEKRRSKACGIKGVPILSQLSSISFPDSFPLDFMHLIWENLLDNLMDLWTSPDSKDEDYHLLAKVWKAIWQSSKDSNATMPSAYGPSMPNTPPDAIPWTSSLRAFWTLFFGPSLLRRRFKHERYYKHFVDLVKLLNICLQFEITRAEIVVVRKGFAKWVVDYERIYYKHDPARLALCPSTLHALLHIADYIEATGPVWCTWAFPMERFCSSIQPAIKSRRFPYASIDSWLVDSAHLMIIKLRFGLSDELSLLPKRIDQGICIPGYRTCAFYPPSNKTPIIEPGVMNKLVAALSTRYSKPVAVIRSCITGPIHEHGTVKITIGGADTLHASEIGSRGPDRRDATFVRYELQVDRHQAHRHITPEYEADTFYGQLQHVYSIPVAKSRKLGLARAEIVVFAVIRTCHISDEDPNGLDIHYYERAGALDVVDLNTVQCLVGRIWVDLSKEWGIVDRSGQLARVQWDDDD